MKVLLTAINAKYIHSNPAIYSLAAYAKNNYKLRNPLTDEVHNIWIERSQAEQ